MPFDLVLGLPVHPLVVHFAVVLLILGSLGLIAIVLVPRWRGALGWVTLGVLAVGTVAAFVAKESGEKLSARVGLPQEHAEWGDRLPWVALLLLAVAAAWFFWQRSSRPGALATVLGVIGIVLAVATMALTTLVGHSGATAVWQGRIDGGGPAPAPSPGGTGASGITASEVLQHASADDCWSVVNGTVYDLTQWIPQHPGGPQVIEAMCGKDGTNAFTNQHGGQQRPEQILASYEVGPYAG
ncbi:MAG: cytochrome b5 domain-containing protein [Candidatus Nanopelagicales bacterium]